MEADDKMLLGPANGKFTLGGAPFCATSTIRISYHQSSSRLKHHLNAKHLAVSLEVRPSLAPDATVNNQSRQTTLNVFLINYILKILNSHAYLMSSRNQKQNDQIGASFIIHRMLCWQDGITAMCDVLSIWWHGLHRNPCIMAKHVIKLLLICNRSVTCDKWMRI